MLTEEGVTERERERSKMPMMGERKSPLVFSYLPNSCHLLHKEIQPRNFLIFGGPALPILLTLRT